MRKLSVPLAVGAAVLAVALTGCGQAGMFAAANLTQVEMSEPNFKVVATGVSGEAEAAYLIGVSFSNGPRTGCIASAERANFTRKPWRTCGRHSRRNTVKWRVGG